MHERGVYKTVVLLLLLVLTSKGECGSRGVSQCRWWYLWVDTLDDTHANTWQQTQQQTRAGETMDRAAILPAVAVA